MWISSLAVLIGLASAYDLEKETQRLVTNEDKCTTIITGAKAGIDGPMVSGTSDCLDCDFRLGKVPARDWPTGSRRPLYVFREIYPNQVSSERGATWQPSNLQGSAEQLAFWKANNLTTGSIPQVAHTYALIEGLYGMMNEHQLSIGESTCASRFTSKPTIAGGQARIEVREMSKIALERTTTAREAIQLMGDLAVQYGYYGADWSGGDASMGEGGETLTVIDKTEAWVFHVSADDLGMSAVWVAQRVPDDHLSVIANQFVIREVDPKSNDFMYSANLWEVAIRNQLWKEGDPPLNWLKTYGMARSHPAYATRRMWRIFSLAAPSTVLPANTNQWADDYPFSVKVDRVLAPQDIMQFNRDHYEGTPYDLTAGVQSGPYGDPARFDITPVDNMTSWDMIQGGYERAISMFRTSYSFVATSRAAYPDSLALMWYGQYAPHATSYTPFYVGTENLPSGYTSGSLFQYDSNVAYWNFCAAGNYASRFYRMAIGDLQALQSSLMATAFDAVQELESSVLNSNLTPSAVVKMVTTLSNEQGNAVIAAWRDLLPQLITKYHDGYQTLDLDQPNIYMKSFFYPKYWLDATGYWNNKPNTAPGTILFDSNPLATNSSSLMGTVIVTAVVSSLSTLVLGAYWLKRNEKMRKFQNNDYININL